MATQPDFDHFAQGQEIGAFFISEGKMSHNAVAEKALFLDAARWNSLTDRSINIDWQIY